MIPKKFEGGLGAKLLFIYISMMRTIKTIVAQSRERPIFFAADLHG